MDEILQTAQQYRSDSISLKLPVSQSAFANSQTKDFGFWFSSNYSNISVSANVRASAVGLQCTKVQLITLEPCLKTNAMNRRATRNFCGQGSKSEKGHTPDHFKAVWDVSFFLIRRRGQKSRDIFQMFASVKHIYQCGNRRWGSGGGGLSREIFLNDTL